MKVAVLSPRRRSARCWSRGRRTRAWMPLRKIVPCSWVYLLASEKSDAELVVMCPLFSWGRGSDQRAHGRREWPLMQMTQAPDLGPTATASAVGADGARAARLRGVRSCIPTSAGVRLALGCGSAARHRVPLGAEERWGRGYVSDCKT